MGASFGRRVALVGDCSTNLSKGSSFGAALFITHIFGRGRKIQRSFLIAPV